MRRMGGLVAKSGFWLWGFPALFLVVFFITPLAKILGVMFTSHGVVSLGTILRPLWFTFWQAVLSVFLTLLVGLPAAVIFAKYNFKWKSTLRVLSTLPFILPTVVVAAGFNALLGPRGLLNEIWMNLFSLESPPILFMNTLGAILTAHVFYNTSVVIRVVGSALAQLDPRVEQAASVLGASPWRVFREITFPRIFPVVRVAALMVFLFDFTSFGTILMLGGPKFATLETEIYTQTMSLLNLRAAGVLSVIQMLCTLVVTLIYTRLHQRVATPLMPRLSSENTRQPRGVAERAVIYGLVGALMFFLTAPLVALAFRSVWEPGSEGGLSLAYYRELFINRTTTYFYVPPATAAFNSLGFAALSTFLAVSLGLLIAYTLVRNQKTTGWLDALIMLPLGTSAVTLGLGFLITFNNAPLDVKNFPLLIPIAHSLVGLPFVVRTILPALVSIPPNLRNAAASLGASPWRVSKEVEAPIISKAVLVGAIYAFAMSLGEFGATSFLARPETPTLPVAIYRYLSQPGVMNYGQAMAMATILMLVCALAIALLDRFQMSEPAIKE